MLSRYLGLIAVRTLILGLAMPTPSLGARPEALTLSMKQAVEIALERNTGVQAARLKGQIRIAGVAEEEERLARGLSTVPRALDAQDELTEARGSRLRAVVDRRTSPIEWAGE